MGKIFLIVMLIAEVLLAGCTLGKKSDKASWLLNRFVLRMGEDVILLGIMLLPVTHQK